jgi:hypothetical protein
MKTTLSFALIFIASIAQAQAVVIDFTGVSKGKHYYEVNLGADGSVTLVEMKTIKIGVSPTPNPNPNPTPDDGAFGLTKLSREEGNKLPVEAKALATKVAENFDAEAAQIAAGARASIEDSQKALKEANRATLGDQRVSWLDWFVAWQEVATKANVAKTLITLENYADAYRATAKGLKDVR